MTSMRTILVFLVRFLAAGFLGSVCATLFLLAFGVFSRTLLLCFFLLIWWLLAYPLRAVRWLPADHKPRLNFRGLVVAEVVLILLVIAELNVES
jgi:hypothetical protein